ncbi:unnamed protein product [Ixodes persulcatus]
MIESLLMSSMVPGGVRAAFLPRRRKYRRRGAAAFLQNGARGVCSSDYDGYSPGNIPDGPTPASRTLRSPADFDANTRRWAAPVRFCAWSSPGFGLGRSAVHRLLTHSHLFSSAVSRNLKRTHERSSSDAHVTQAGQWGCRGRPPLLDALPPRQPRARASRNVRKQNKRKNTKVEGVSHTLNRLFLGGVRL